MECVVEQTAEERVILALRDCTVAQNNSLVLEFRFRNILELGVSVIGSNLPYDSIDSLNGVVCFVCFVERILQPLGSLVCLDNSIDVLNLNQLRAS